MTNGKCRRFEDKVILITGATGGIGRALSYRFADEGGTVILNFHQDSSRFTAEQMLGEIGTSSKSGTAQADITDPEQVKAMFVRIKEIYGQLDVLVNNAGINLNSLFVRTRPEDWKNLLDVNVMGTVYCCQQAILLMNRSGGGTIVNSSSMIGLSGNAGQAIYATTKAGIVGLTKSLAREYAAKNIRVNAVAAGFVDA